ncbi:hypothetical protein ACFVWR_17075 [Leifsonia sp. NPDC058292]|uniref:hypothetical protein n=1 Tax=Leifsonia sp. NPDC058292 TaxID=3346428 RepID=UPI0036DD06E9
MRARGGSGERPRAFWVVRSRAQAGVLVATAVTVLVVTFLATAMVGLAARSPAVAVRQSIDAGPASAVSLALQASLDTGTDDRAAAAAQDTTVRSIIRKSFAGAHVEVARTASVPSLPLTAEDGSERSALALGDDAALRSRATIVSGVWPGNDGSGSPSSPIGVAVDSELARTLSLATGKTFSVEGSEGTLILIVTGVWRPTHPAAPAWLGITAGSGGIDGRIVVAPAVLDILSTTPAVQWVVSPDAERTTAGQLGTLRAGFGGVADALTESSNASSSPFSGLGDAAVTMAAMQQSIGALSAVVPVPLAVLSVCSAIAFVLLAQLLARSRLPETRVLRARGATVGDLVRAGAIESSVVAVTGAVLGAALAQAALVPLVGPPRGAVEVALPPVIVVVAALAAAMLITGLSARSASGSPGAVEAGRGRAAVSLGLAVLAVAAAGVTLWRFLAFGSPVSASGGIDPVGVIAPAAVLCAIAMLGLLLFGPAAAAVEVLAARGSGLSAVLPARQVGRGLALFAAPVALVVLTVGAATFSAGYVGTWSGFLRDSSVLVNGSDVRADLGVAGTVRGPEDAAGAARFGSIPSVTAAAPALVTDVSLGQGTVGLIAVDARRLGDLTDVGAYLFDAAEAAKQLTAGGSLRGAQLPSDAKIVQARATVVVPDADAAADPALGMAAAPALSVTFWVADAGGELVPLTAAPPTGADAGSAGGAGVVEASLPEGGPWTLVAVDTHLDTTETATAADVAVDAIGTRTSSSSALVGVTLPAGQKWAAAAKAFGSAFAITGLPKATLGYRAALVPAGRDNAVRFMAGGDDTVPVVFTQTAAGATSLDRGQAISLEGPWVDVEATVAGTVPAIPGTTQEAAALVDLRALDNQVLRTSPTVPRLASVWLATDRIDATAAAARRVAGPDAAVSTASGAFVARFMSSAVLSLWLGTAGCAALALVALGAAVAALLRRRRGEVIVLRAVGMGARQQARSRRSEILGVVAAAGVFGLIGGVAVFLLAGNTLARLSVVTAPSTLSVQGRVDLIGLLVALAAVAAAIGLVLWFYGRAVRRQVADTQYREETR